MSRNQRIILVVLGVAVVLVYGCLGAYGLIRLTERVRTTQRQRVVQAAGTPPAAVSPTACPISTTALTVPSLAAEAPRPTNTRVIPPVSPTLVPPTSVATAHPAHASSPTYTPHPAQTVPPGTTPPPQLTPTLVPSPTLPPSPPPSPTVDTRCAGKENAYHQQMLANIEEHYGPILSWIEYEMEQAVRDRDTMRVQELQLEHEMCENMMAADIDAENARHQAALAACG